MKTTKANRRMAPREASKREEESESLSLSPERLRDRTETKTELLNEMLERETRNYNLRYWGINE